MQFSDILDQGLHYDGKCCNDCAVLIVNGDDSGLGADFDMATFEDCCAAWDVTVGDECDYETSQCAVCGTGDHGDRHSVTMVDRALYATNTYEV